MNLNKIISGQIGFHVSNMQGALLLETTFRTYMKDVDMKQYDGTPGSWSVQNKTLLSDSRPKDSENIYDAHLLESIGFLSVAGRIREIKEGSSELVVKSQRELDFLRKILVDNWINSFPDKYRNTNGEPMFITNGYSTEKSIYLWSNEKYTDRMEGRLVEYKTAYYPFSGTADIEVPSKKKVVKNEVKYYLPNETFVNAIKNKESISFDIPREEWQNIIRTLKDLRIKLRDGKELDSVALESLEAYTRYVFNVSIVNGKYLMLHDNRNEYKIKDFFSVAEEKEYHIAINEIMTSFNLKVGKIYRTNFNYRTVLQNESLMPEIGNLKLAIKAFRPLYQEFIKGEKEIDVFLISDNLLISGLSDIVANEERNKTFVTVSVETGVLPMRYNLILPETIEKVFKNKKIEKISNGFRDTCLVIEDNIYLILKLNPTVQNLSAQIDRSIIDKLKFFISSNKDLKAEKTKVQRASDELQRRKETLIDNIKDIEKRIVEVEMRKQCLAEIEVDEYLYGSLAGLTTIDNIENNGNMLKINVGDYTIKMIDERYDIYDRQENLILSKVAIDVRTVGLTHDLIFGERDIKQAVKVMARLIREELMNEQAGN